MRHLKIYQVPVLLMTILLLALAVRPVRTQAALEKTQEPWTDNKANAIKQTEYALDSSGKVHVTLKLNTTYQGLSATKWTICYMTGTSDPKTEELSFNEMKSAGWSYTIKTAFDQGEVVIMAAYTDAMAANWDTPGDELELMQRGHAVAIPSEPADPKAGTDSIKTADAENTYTKTVSMEGRGKLYIKVEVLKDTRVEWAKWNYQVENNVFSLQPSVALYDAEENDEAHASFYSRDEGDVDVWEPGTYWLCVKNTSDSKMELAMTLKYRQFIPSTGVKWTIDGKAVKDNIAEVRSAGSTIKGKLLPANTDAVFCEDEIATEYVGITNVKLSKDKKSFTGKIPGSYADGMSSVKAWVYDRHITSRTNGTVCKNYELEIGRAYSGGKPYVSSGNFTVYHNSFNYNPKILDPNLYLRIYQKKGSKWKKRYDGKAMGDILIKGLKQNTSYTFKMDYCYKKNGKNVATKATKVKIRTGSKTKPVIQSVRISNRQTKTRWVEGHWIHGTVYNTWKPGYSEKYYTFDMTVTLKKNVPAGALGIQLVNASVVSGNNTEFKKGSGNTFVFKCTTGVKSMKINVRYYSDKNFGGLSPISKTKTVKIV